MHFVELTPQDQQKYNDFVKNHPAGSIHQTWEWALFQSKTPGREYYKIFALVDDEKKIQASALIIQQTLPFGKNWWYCPRGPLLDYKNAEMVQSFFKALGEQARKQNTLYVRVEAPLAVENILNFENPLNQTITQNIKNVGAKPAHAHYQPEHTLVLDLKLSANDLLKQMKPKGRYNIKVAQKHEVEIRLSDGNDADIDAFYQLLQQTTSRDQFSGHSKDYYRHMMKTLGTKSVSEKGGLQDGQALQCEQACSSLAKLYLAEYQSKTIAGMIVTYFKNTAIYYFGASGNEHRNVMAPYLLQWKAMLDAKEAGMHFYDFLGIAPENDPDHPWAKVSDFKLKFGGVRINYLPAQEIIYKPLWFWGLRLMKKIKKLLREK